VGTKRGAIHVNARGRVLTPQCLACVRRNRWRLGHFRDQPAAGVAELQLAVGQSLDLETLLVDRAVMPSTQQDEVRELRRPALRPVLDVMTLRVAQSTTREAAAVIATL